MLTLSEIANPLLGGALIGVAASLMLLLNGRVTGISGIVKGMIHSEEKEFPWRLSFVLGLVLSGFIFKEFGVLVYREIPDSGPWVVSIAGLVVGIGTALGNGCTSGHGVCGISRFSLRSIVATLVFIAFGMLSVFLVKQFQGALL